MAGKNVPIAPGETDPDVPPITGADKNVRPSARGGKNVDKIDSDQNDLTSESGSDSESISGVKT